MKILEITKGTAASVIRICAASRKAVYQGIIWTGFQMIAGHCGGASSPKGLWVQEVEPFAKKRYSM